ncbi:V-type ATP synthase subunit D [Candidatus Bathyarchaeota archaeon]|nr:V-type ATP synthase subunit D [Candidatus Bathyarchaeota archaeon]
MSIELASVHPTRLELLKLRHRKSMAEGIVDILKKEVDALTLRLFEILQQYSSLREKMYTNFEDAYNLFIEAQMTSGSKKIEEISLVSPPIDLEFSEEIKKGILGLLFPLFYLKIGNNLSEPRFNPFDTKPNVDKSSSSIIDSLKQIIKIAEIQQSVKILLDIIAVKKRQMNRLQFKIIPKLETTIRYIELILEDTERQDAIRVRVLQRKRKERGLKHGK